MNIRQERLQAIIDSGITSEADIIKTYNATYPRQSKKVLTQLINDMTMQSIPTTTTKPELSSETSSSSKLNFPVDGPAVITPKQDSFITLTTELFTIGRLLVILTWLLGKAAAEFILPRIVSLSATTAHLWCSAMKEIERLTEELMSIYIRRLVRLPLAPSSKVSFGAFN